MKIPDRNTVTKLEELPNIGRVISKYINLIGIETPQMLIGQNPYDLYEKLCEKTGKKFDPCLLDTFIAAVHFMEGGDPLPWWAFTENRKKEFVS